MNSLDEKRLENGKPDPIPSDNQLERRARQLWHEAAHHIDPATAGRLRAARRGALQAVDKPAHHATRWLIPSGAFAVIALAALMVWRPLPPPNTPTAVSSVNSTIEDADTELPPDADKTDPNLYQNLDFYDWLASTNSPPAKH